MEERGTYSIQQMRIEAHFRVKTCFFVENTGVSHAILGLRDRFRAGRVGHPGTECVRSFEAPATHSCSPGGYCNDGLRAPHHRRGADKRERRGLKAGRSHAACGREGALAH